MRHFQLVIRVSKDPLRPAGRIDKALVRKVVIVIAGELRVEVKVLGRSACETEGKGRRRSVSNWLEQGPAQATAPTTTAPMRRLR